MKHIIVLAEYEGEYEDVEKIIKGTYLIDTGIQNFDIWDEFKKYLAEIYNNNGIKCSYDKEKFGNEIVIDFWRNRNSYKKETIKELNKLYKSINEKYAGEMEIIYFVEKVLKAEKIEFSEYSMF